MTFEQLYYFSVTAEVLNFTKAAELLYISQPTLSRQIVLLENELNAKLFNRDYREVSLTEAGRILKAECGPILDNYSGLKKKIENSSVGIVGNLSIASLDIYYSELYNCLKDYLRKYPDVLFQMHSRELGLFSTEIATGKCDIGISWSLELIDNPDEYEVLPLYDDRFVAVISNSHPYAGRESVTLEEIKRERTIFVSWNKYDSARKLLMNAGLDEIAEKGFYIPDSIESLFLQLKASFRSIGIVPLSIAREKGSGCALAEISNWDSSFHTVMIWKKKNTSPTVQNFVSMVKEVFRDGPKPVTISCSRMGEKLCPEMRNKLKKAD